MSLCSLLTSSKSLSNLSKIIQNNNKNITIRIRNFIIVYLFNALHLARTSIGVFGRSDNSHLYVITFRSVPLISAQNNTRILMNSIHEIINAPVTRNSLFCKLYMLSIIHCYDTSAIHLVKLIELGELLLFC